MKVSKRFLNDYVDCMNIDAKDLADKLVSVGNEYDATSKLVDVSGLVIGEIVECKMHPESDKLHICQVNLGDKTVQILCGAPNARKGIKVIVATVGAKLPGGEIKKAKLAGMESNGMLCALNELGIEKKYLKQSDIDGICELPLDAPLGEDPIKYLGLDDEVIDFDFTTNRADMLSMLGIAYEVAAAYNLDVKYPLNEVSEKGDDIKDYKIDVQTDKCSIYLGKVVKNVSIKESPLFIKNRLMASGIRPINNVVDISNYVMLEYGTPLHFFDADKLGEHVIVRNAFDGEKLTTLDGQERVLEKTDLVIAKDDEAVCLAGVMGGLSTEVTDDTKNIFIECAIFNPTSIRITSKKIVRSEASNRYEKGVDPSRILPAIKRASYLLNKYASGEVTKGEAVYDTTSKEDKVIDITLEKINNVLGMNLKVKDVINSLERLNFKVKNKGENFTVYVPTRRLDVNIKEDIIEEVGRIYGYDKIKGILPTLKTRIGKRSKKKTMDRILRERLEALGLNQVITYSLLSDSQSHLFEDEKEKIVLLNPMSEDRKVLRTTLITSLLEVYQYNIDHNVKDINIFETGEVYFKEKDYKEELRVSGLMSGEYLVNSWQNIKIVVDFYTVKGVVENLLKYLGFKNRYSFRQAKLKDMHPGRTAEILLDRKPLGIIGEVSPNLSKKPVYVFEINVSTLLDQTVKDAKYKEISKYPSVSKDAAFIVSNNVNSLEVEEVIRKAGGHLLTDIKLFDVYEGINVLENEKSLAYSLTFSSPVKTLSEDEVMEVFNNIIKNCEDKLGAKLRSNK
jgi:phenylalanyl-tRNA synthetase beta chain